MNHSPPGPVLKIARGIGRGTVVAVFLTLGLPVLLLLPGAVLSPSPSRTARATLFPIAVAVFDPFLWICVRNSFIVAFITTIASLGIGVPLARAVGPCRYWGRGPLAALSWVPLAVLPGFAALGLLQIFSPYHLGRILTQRTVPLMFGQTWEQWITWLFIIWVNLLRSVPLVALSAKAALGRVDPTWADAGRALGASKGRAWRQLVWPIIRPEAARTLAAVFAFTLLDPSAPLILGLRRTLPFQIVDAVTREDPPTRLAILGLIALISAFLGRSLIRWWGGPRVAINQFDRQDRPTQAVWWRAGLGIASVSLWLAVSWLPLVGLLQIVVDRQGVTEPRAWVVSGMSVVYAITDPDVRTFWLNSLSLAFVVTFIDFMLIKLQRILAQRSGGVSLIILGFERTPPLVFGLACAAMPGILLALSSAFHWPRLAQVATWFDPVRWPGVLLIAATAASRLPTLARAADRADLRARPGLFDAALTIGASSRTAKRLEGGRGAGFSIFMLTFALSATAIAPAILLTPTSRTRTVGVAFVHSVEDRPKAASLAFGAIGLNLVGLIAARRSRSGPAGDWFRG